MGEKAKDTLPGAGRSGSTTGDSSGQGYSQEGRGVTSGTGKFMPLLASGPQPHVETLWCCPLYLAAVIIQRLYNLHFLSFSLVKCQVCSSWPGKQSR